MESKRKLRPVYGVGLIALEHTPEKLYESKDEAIKNAVAEGLAFVVEFNGKGKKILSWNSTVKNRSLLIEKYSEKQDVEMLAKLNSSEEPFWLELIGSSNANYLMPLSLVEAYERI